MMLLSFFVAVLSPRVLVAVCFQKTKSEMCWAYLPSLLSRMISTKSLSRSASRACTSLPSNSLTTLALSESRLSLSSLKVCSRMSSSQVCIAGPKCSTKCLKPSAPPPPPMAFDIKGPVNAYRGPKLLVMQVSVSLLEFTFI